ncbi:hypothetical protein LCGC14_2389600 [marine sediment metagenome]|uniref:Uncharacterized protein n=1 Tax=marine sediment metagenome TaxID=412755 RepID=A0A0F9CKK8_9ZZZZ
MSQAKNVGIYIDEDSKCNEVSNNLFSDNGEDIQGTPEACRDEKEKVKEIKYPKSKEKRDFLEKNEDNLS